MDFIPEELCEEEEKPKKVLCLGNIKITLEEGQTLEDLLFNTKVEKILGAETLLKIYRAYKRDVKNE